MLDIAGLVTLTILVRRERYLYEHFFFVN